MIAKLRQALAEKERNLAEKISKSKIAITSPIVTETGHVQSDSKTVAGNFFFFKFR